MAIAARRPWGYEIQASRRRHDWELLSEACDRYRTRHPVIVYGVVVTITVLR